MHAFLPCIQRYKLIPQQVDCLWAEGSPLLVYLHSYVGLRLLLATQFNFTLLFATMFN